MILDRRLSRPGASLAFFDSGGDGVPVVLTHGAGIDATMWEAPVAALVARGRRVIAWDLRGHGTSELRAGTPFRAEDALADLGALLDETATPRAVLVGHSLGGNLTQAFARAHPERTAGAIIVGATWNDGPLSPGARLALRLAAPSLALVPARSLPALMARASAVTATGVARAEAVFARMPKRRFLEVWRATTSFVTPDEEPAFPARLALVHGERDSTGNIATAMTAWARAAGVREYVVAGAGHILTWDAPDDATRTLLRILDDEMGDTRPL